MTIELAAVPAEISFLTDAAFYEVAEATAGWDGEYVQLGRGPCRGSIQQVRLQGVDLAVDWLDNRVRTRATPPPGGILLALSGDSRQPLSWRGRSVAPDTLVFQGADQEVDVEFSGGVYYWVADAKELEGLLGRRALISSIARGRLALAPQVAERLREFTAGALTSFGSRPEFCVNPKACAELRNQTLLGVAALLRGASQHEGRLPPVPARRAAARRVEAYMLKNLGSSISMQTLVDFADVRERALRNGFNDLFGRSPMEHFTTLRLNVAHARLRAAEVGETSVGAVARESGFGHLGRFASTYRIHFGELPSETLRGS